MPHPGPLDILFEDGAQSTPYRLEAALTSIAISLKRLADHLAPLEESGKMPPLLWLGDVIRGRGL